MNKEHKIEPIELKGPFGEYVYKEYIGRAEKDYHNAPALTNWGKCEEFILNDKRCKEYLQNAGPDTYKVLTLLDDSVKGSNPASAILINKIVKPSGLRTLSPKEVEQVLEDNTLPLRASYITSALVLRNPYEGPNTYLAQDLTSQITKWAGKSQTPLMIPLHSLELKLDQNTSHGVSFKLREDAEVIYAPELDFKNNGKTFAKTNGKGLPHFEIMGQLFGTRKLITGDSGLSAFSLTSDLNLDSHFHLLACSGSLGRILLVNAAK